MPLLERCIPKTWFPGVQLTFATGKERVSAAVFQTNRSNEINDFWIDLPDGATVEEHRQIAQSPARLDGFQCALDSDPEWFVNRLGFRHHQASDKVLRLDPDQRPAPFRVS